MAGTVTLTTHNDRGNVRSLIYTCVADAAAATFPTRDLPSIEGRILALVTNPGTTAPTNAYDVTLINQHGYDVLQSLGLNRDGAAPGTFTTQQVPIVYSGTGTHPCVDTADTLTLTISNNAVNSAEVVIQLYYAPGA